MLPEIKVRIDADTTGLTKGLAAATEKLTKFGKVAGAAIGVAVVGAAAGLAALTKAAIDNADELGKASQKMGMTVEALSRLQYAAKLSGVELSGLQTGMNALARNMAAGSDAFKQLGVSITNSDGSLRSSRSVIGDIADRFAGMEDGATKTALAMEIFGRSGADLIPLLNGAAAGLDAMDREADNVGATISGTTAKAAERFNDTIAKIQATMGGVVNKIMVAVLPALQSVADTMASPAFAEAAAGLGQAIVSGLSVAIQVVTGLTNAARDLFSYIAARSSQGFATVDEASIKTLEDRIANTRRILNDPGNVGQDMTNLRNILAKEEAALAGRKFRDPLGKGADFGQLSAFAMGTDSKVPTITLPTLTTGDVDAERERIAARLAVIQEGFLSENELLTQKYADDQQLLDDALAKKLMTEQEHQAAIQSLEQQHADKLSAIRDAAQTRDLQSMGSFFGAVGSIMEQGGGQMLGIAKAFGAAQALINSYVAASQALADPTVPFWGKAAAFASMVATGLQAVSSIKGASPGGGGGAPTAASSGGVASSAMNRTLTVQGITPGQIFSGDAMRDFMERMLDMQRDGYQVVLA